MGGIIRYKFDFEYAEHIREICKTLNIKHKDLSVKAGCGVNYVTGILKGATLVPNFQLLYSLCYVLNKERKRKKLNFNELCEEENNIVIDVMKLVEEREYERKQKMVL